MHTLHAYVQSGSQSWLKLLSWSYCTFLCQALLAMSLSAMAVVLQASDVLMPVAIMADYEDMAVAAVS